MEAAHIEIQTRKFNSPPTLIKTGIDVEAFVKVAFSCIIIIICDMILPKHKRSAIFIFRSILQVGYMGHILMLNRFRKTIILTIKHSI
jgi:hypothetical protein